MTIHATGYSGFKARQAPASSRRQGHPGDNGIIAGELKLTLNRR
jgi:hypothetical protein